MDRKDLFPDSYFEQRNLNDPKRLKSFELEKEFISKFCGNDGVICDVGCSTGEFLEHIKWEGNRYGEEINDLAKLEAEKKKISFDIKLCDANAYFDVIIFRGTIQHINEPFRSIEDSYRALKKGGLLFILSTPDIDSLCYRLFRRLPALDQERCYFLPSARQVEIICQRAGYQLKAREYPYWNSGYDSPLRDFSRFFLNLVLPFNKSSFAFPGNMMNLCFMKE